MIFIIPQSSKYICLVWYYTLKNYKNYKKIIIYKGWIYRGYKKIKNIFFLFLKNRKDIYIDQRLSKDKIQSSSSSSSFVYYYRNK